MADVPALNALIAASVRQLSIGFYTAAQVDAALRAVFGVDSQLVADGTYYIVDGDSGPAAAGGWSGRGTLYGGDQAKDARDPRLDPATDPARIRAFFVHPAYARRGLARQLYRECERAALAAGFRRFELMATLPGEPLYAALGFSVVEPVVLSLEGVDVPFKRMMRGIGGPLIRRSTEADFPAMLAIVNDAAEAYRGVIPADRWHDPYMSADELAREIGGGGVVFWVAEDDGRLTGVMGIQDKGDVALVRHAYVIPTTQRSGVGTHLLRHVTGVVDKPILIGTWASASWAIDFYRRNGFVVVPTDEKDRLLRTYWSIPQRQIETSVVLADARWTESRPRAS